VKPVRLCVQNTPHGISLKLTRAGLRRAEGTGTQLGARLFQLGFGQEVDRFTAAVRTRLLPRSSATSNRFEELKEVSRH
jgi:hypothetical protein